MRDLRHLLDTATAADLPDLVAGLRALITVADEAHIYYYRHPVPSAWHEHAKDHLDSVDDVVRAFTSASCTAYDPPPDDGTWGVGS